MEKKTVYAILITIVIAFVISRFIFNGFLQKKTGKGIAYWKKQPAYVAPVTPSGSPDIQQ